MKKSIQLMIAAAALLSLATVGIAKEDSKTPSGEELFKTHCSACHVNGSNIINPMKTLQKKDRDANNIHNPKDIIGKMRNPGPGMTKFDKTTISDEDAKKIAEYILKTFN